MKRQNDRILKEKLPRSVGAQYATGDQWRNNSRKNEGMEPKQKEDPTVDVMVIEARSDAVKSSRSKVSGKFALFRRPTTVGESRLVSKSHQNHALGLWN